MSSQAFWYAARASGIVAWALAAAAVVWGLALSARVSGQRPRRPWLFDLHRFSLTCNEIQHLFAVLVAVPVADPGHRLRWSWSRRRRQARARACHYRRQAAQQP